MRFIEKGRAIISTKISDRKVKFDINRYDREHNKEIDVCLSCEENKCIGECQIIRCLNCEHLKWFGDLAIRYCGITDKPIIAKTVCPIKYVNGDRKG